MTELHGKQGWNFCASTENFQSDNPDAAHSKRKITSILWLKERKSQRHEVPNQSPAGPGAGDHLQGGVVADFGCGAERPRLQDVLHQAAIAADDVQGLHHKLLGLIWGAKNRANLIATAQQEQKKLLQKQQTLFF